MNKEYGVKLNVDIKEVDRIAIGARLYDMLDGSNNNNNLHCKDGKWFIDTDTAREMVELVNPLIKMMHKINEKQALYHLFYETKGMTEENQIRNVEKIIKEYDKLCNIEEKTISFHVEPFQTIKIINATSASEDTLNKFKRELAWYVLPNKMYIKEHRDVEAERF